MEEACKQMLFK